MIAYTLTMNRTDKPPAVPVVEQHNLDYPTYPVAELHAHLGTSIPPAILWQIAHDMGVQLPRREYNDFFHYVTLSPERPMPLNEYFEKIYHPILDRLSSGTLAVEAAVYNTMSGAYRNGITLIELRTNPMKHNLNAAVDLDHLIMAMLRGMERALLEHSKLSAGIVFCIGREYTVKQNAKIIEKAIKYRHRGIIGIDIAGPGRADFNIRDYESLFEEARQMGLGVTVHSGEAVDANDMWDAVKYIRPSRIGHGVLAARDKKLMAEIRERGIVLEVCPLSNLATKALADKAELKYVLRTFMSEKVPFCINTDWPEIIDNGHLRKQYRMLLDEGFLTDQELRAYTETAFKASFIKGPGIEAYI